MICYTGYPILIADGYKYKTRFRIRIRIAETLDIRHNPYFLLKNNSGEALPHTFLPI